MSETSTPGTSYEQTIAEKQASWLKDLEFEQLPADIVAQAKRCLLDYIGVALRGSTLPQIKPARELVASAQGAEEATVIGGDKTTVPYAAYANGTFGHSCEYDDSHFHAGHPGVCVIPAALAVGESRQISGKDLITAIVAGYQSMVWSVGPLNRITLDLGWHGTKIGGVFGAAAACGKILKLNEVEMAHALAVAASDASGTMEYDQSGGEIKRFHAGIASRAGTEAAFLASFGLTGPLTIFEGKRGIFGLFGHDQPLNVEDYWQGQYHIMDTMFKLHPCAGTLHAAIDCTREIRERTGISANSVEEIEVGIADWAIPHGAAIIKPEDVISAQFSLAFSIGLQFKTGANAIMDYMDHSKWSDPAILEIAHKVKPVAVDTPEGASELCARVTIRTNDGHEEEAFQIAPRGYPTLPATEEDLQAKFLSVTEGLLTDEQVAALLDAINNLENQPDLSFVVDAYNSIAKLTG